MIVQENKDTYIIVGLGNPGKKYMGTRHNVGFDFLETLSKKYNFMFENSKFNAMIAKGIINSKKVYLVMPMTFMNLSGDAVSKIANYYKIAVNNIVVCYDDIYLDVGKLRIRKNGSAGGHNGMKSIIARIGSMDFPRIRIGVGKKPENMDLADYVLSHFSKSEYNDIDNAIFDAIDAAEKILNDDILDAMNKYN